MQLKKEAKMSKKKWILAYQWILRLASAAILFQTLFFKFTGSSESIYIFTKVGMEPWGRIGSGVVELIASVCFLYTPICWLGALIASAVMFGAIFSHLTLLGIEVQGDGGLLFALACSVFVLSIQTLYFQRASIPFVGQFLNAEEIKKN